MAGPTRLLTPNMLRAALGSRVDVQVGKTIIDGPLNEVTSIAFRVGDTWFRHRDRWSVCLASDAKREDHARDASDRSEAP